jgi:hypothetical protein
MRDKVVGLAILGASLGGYYYIEKGSEKPEVKYSSMEENSEAEALYNASIAPVESVIPNDLQPKPMPNMDMKNSGYPDDIKDAPESEASQYFNDLWIELQDEYEGFVRWIGPVRRAIAAVVENRQAVRATRQERRAPVEYYPEAPVAPEIVPVAPDVIPEPVPTPVEAKGSTDGVPECKCGPDCPCKKVQAAPVVQKSVVVAPAPKVVGYQNVVKQGWVKVCNLNGTCHMELRSYVERVPVME